MKNKNTFFITIATLLISPLFVSAQSWSGPSSSPPNGNTATPINISSTGQEKSGALTIDGVFTNQSGALINTNGAPNGLLVQYGNVGIDTTSPQAPLSVSGGNDQLDFYHPNDNQFSIQTVLDGQSLSGYNYGGGQNQLFLQPDIGEVTIGTPTGQYTYPLYVNGSIGVNGNLHLVGGRSTIFIEGDNNSTQVGGLQMVTYDNGVHTILTPTDQNGNTINSTVQLGGGGAFNSNTINLNVSGSATAGSFCLGSACISSWTGAEQAGGASAFGGMFMTASNGVSRVNPLTGGLNCPSGFSQHGYDSFQDLGGVTHTQYFCSNP